MSDKLYRRLWSIFREEGAAPAESALGNDTRKIYCFSTYGAGSRDFDSALIGVKPDDTLTSQWQMKILVKNGSTEQFWVKLKGGQARDFSSRDEFERFFKQESKNAHLDWTKYLDYDEALFQTSLRHQHAEYQILPEGLNAEALYNLFEKNIQDMDAVVITHSCIRPFEELRAYCDVVKRFPVKKERLFFAFTHYDLVDDQEEFHSAVRKKLTEKLHLVDEGMYQKRVFYVDAYTSMCARTKTPKRIRKGDREIQEYVSPSEDLKTGMPEFEKELYRYLGV